jgi:hypothetical protein
MKLLRTYVAVAFLAATESLCAYAAAAEPATRIEFVRHQGSLDVSIGGQMVATYCYQDRATSRPFFTHVKTVSGIEVTRRYPPVEGQDLTDHATFHPGIWLAFGDLSGADYWRLKARVRHAAFVEEPSGGAGRGSFAVQNEYIDPNDPTKIICRETARFTLFAQPTSYLLTWDSRLSSDHDFYFGDQEEMGLGFRVATPLRVGAAGADILPPGNGVILDANRRKNERQIWGNAAKWCDYSGTLAGKSVGMAILCHPANVRPSWFHARDYGLLVANLFGQKSFGKGEVSRIVVRAGEEFRLRYGVFVHQNVQDSQANLDAAYQEYVRLSGN